MLRGLFVVKEFRMTKTCEYLQDLLHQEIPITQALQISVDSWQNHQLTMTLPLAPNVNHMSSAFGGSLYCGAVIVGWGWMHLRLKELGITNGHIVIQEGQITYPHPVLGDAEAICIAPDEVAWAKFEKVFKRHQKGRLALNSVLLYEGKEAVVFTGQYVVYCD